MTSTSLARIIWRSPSQASARYRASAPVGNDSRRFSVFLTPNSASSNAFRSGCSETLFDRILKHVSVEFLRWSYVHDGCQGRGHVHNARKFGVSTGFDISSVKEYRNVRIRIVRAAVLRGC